MKQTFRWWTVMVFTISFSLVVLVIFSSSVSLGD